MSESELSKEYPDSVRRDGNVAIIREYHDQWVRDRASRERERGR